MNDQGHLSMFNSKFFQQKKKEKKQVLDHWPMLKITFEALSTLWRGKLACLAKKSFTRTYSQRSESSLAVETRQLIATRSDLQSRKRFFHISSSIKLFLFANIKKKVGYIEKVFGDNLTKLSLPRRLKIS